MRMGRIRNSSKLIPKLIKLPTNASPKVIVPAYHVHFSKERIPEPTIIPKTPNANANNPGRRDLVEPSEKTINIDSRNANIIIVDEMIMRKPTI